MGRFNLVKTFGMNNKFDKYILKKEGEKINLFLSVFFVRLRALSGSYFTILHAH